MKFSCADLATVVTGKLCVDVERLYQIYNFLTGDRLYTHQLPRAYRFCDLHIDDQFPEIAPMMRAASGLITAKTYKAIMAEWRKKWGDEFEAKPIEGWLCIDPLAELETMVPKDKIITVQP